MQIKAIDRIEPITVDHMGDRWTLYRGDSEAYIHDLDWARKLGYAYPADIRKLIRRLATAGRLGIIATVAIIHGGAGRPGHEFYLTEGQALKLAAKSDTEFADKVLDDVIAVFLLARQQAEHWKVGPPGGVMQQLSALLRAEVRAAIREELGWAVADPQSAEVKVEGRKQSVGSGCGTLSWSRAEEGLRVIAKYLDRVEFTCADVAAALGTDLPGLDGFRDWLRRMGCTGPRLAGKLGYIFRKAHRDGLLINAGAGSQNYTRWRLRGGGSGAGQAGLLN